MNGKKAKYLRRSAAYITDLPTTYVVKHHRKKGMFPEFNAKGELVAMEEKEYTAIQVLLGRCTRQVYQLMKRLPRRQHATQS